MFPDQKSGFQAPIVKKKISMMGKKKVRQSAPSSVDGLPSVLADWSQATNHFHALYVTLQETIDKLKQHALTTESVRHSSLTELEEVNKEMILELNRLLNNMDNPLVYIEEEPTQSVIERLRLHTTRLQKQAKRIQAVLGLSSLMDS